MILENIIETKLKQTYSDQFISEFYQSFKENFSQYEKINNEVVDTIFGFTNFEKFK